MCPAPLSRAGLHPFFGCPSRSPPSPVPADLCPICFSEAADFVLDHCGCAACFGCLRTHAATEIKPGQQPRCPLCLAAGGGAAPAAAGPADGSSSMLISRSQLEYLLDAADLLVHDRRQVRWAIMSGNVCSYAGRTTMPCTLHMHGCFTALLAMQHAIRPSKRCASFHSRHIARLLLPPPPRSWSSC